MFFKNIVSPPERSAAVEVRFLLIAVDVLIGVGDVQEEVFLVMFLKEIRCCTLFLTYSLLEHGDKTAKSSSNEDVLIKSVFVYKWIATL